jgi:agmatine/peptidylarginine deiminase
MKGKKDRVNNTIRFISELEPVKEMTIVWPKANPKKFGGYEQEKYYFDLIKSIKNIITVTIIVDNNAVRNRIITKLKENHISLEKLNFLKILTSSIWVRDYGPFYIEKNNELSIVDFHFRRFDMIFLPFDSLFNIFYSLKQKVDKNIFTNFLLTIQGGNFMADRQGIGFTADYIFRENRHLRSKKKVILRLKKYLGLRKLIVLQSQIKEVSKGGDRSGHIDMFAKLLDENKILVGKYYDKNDVNYQILEDNAKKLEKLGYNVIRIPMIHDKKNSETIFTYTNSLVVNSLEKKVVLVPQYDLSEDKKAIEIYKKAMTNYEIIGVDCSSIIKHHGAIHCTTFTTPFIRY